MDKLIHIIVYAVAAITLWGCHGSHSGSGAAENPDLAFNIQQITIDQPEKALTLLDSAERNGLIRPFLIDYLRCLAYHNGLSDYKRAISYALRAYRDPEVATIPEIHRSLIDMIANEYFENGNYEESIRYCNEGLEKAIKDNDRLLEANLNVTLATDLAALKRNDEALGRLNTAADILEKEATQNADDNEAWRVWDDYVYALGMIIQLLTDNERWDEALAMQQRYDEAVRGLEGSDCPIDELPDMRKASGYATFAWNYAGKGDLKNARRMFDKFSATRYASTHDGNLMIVPYLTRAGRFDEALHIIRGEKQYWKETADTISDSYITMCLNNELKIYDELNDFKSANLIRNSIIAIGDSIHKQDSKIAALELAEVYKNTEQTHKIEQQKSAIQKRNILIAAFTVFLILAIIFIVNVFRYNRMVRNKNMSLRRTIDELIDYKDKLHLKQEEMIKMNDELAHLERRDVSAALDKSPDSHTVTENPDKDFQAEAADNTDGAPAADDMLRDSDRILFDRINSEILNKKLYLDPDFSRNYLLGKFHIPVNRFSMIFKVFAGCSFTQYVQQCRLDHAVRIMRDNPNWSLEAIAKDSNMSRSTFYDQFQKKYGLKPSEFRNQYNDNE